MFVGQVVNEFGQALFFAEEMLADVGARLDGVLLVLAIHYFIHPVDKVFVRVLRQQGIVIAAPDDFENIPPSAPEDGLKLLDDFAVSANRPIEPLQVAVDHKN